MKRKILSFGIILCMLIGLVVVPVMAAEVNGLCGDDLIWVFNSNGTLTISGTGDMWDYNNSDDMAPWLVYRKHISTVIVDDDVTSIGDYAFLGCENIISVTIGNKVANIGNGAFSSCSSLASIEIPDSVTNIGVDAFSFCSSLASIEIPDSVTSIGDSAFSFCSNLASIEIPNSVTTIGCNAFVNCKFNSIVLSDSMTKIEWFLFMGCSNLTSITIPASVKIVEESAFEYCDSLTDVYYGGSEGEWNGIYICEGNETLKNAAIHYGKIVEKLSTQIDKNGETVSLLENSVLDVGEELYFRNGYVDASKGYIKTGDRKITGSNIYFTSEGKIRLDDGYNAKIERDNGDGTTNQGFIFGKYNPSGIIKVILDVTGEAGGVDYTGKTIEKDFDFTCSEIYGLANFGFEIANIPKPLEFYVHED